MLTIPVSKPSTARNLVRLTALLGLIIVGMAGGVQAQEFEGKKISSVEIRYNGAKTVDEARIRNLMSSKAGTIYSAEHVDTDVKSLYESGSVEDVRFLAEPVGDTVRLIAEITSRDEYVAVGFMGNKKFSDQKLAKECKLKSRGLLSDEVILEARRNIEKYYQGYGYPDVLVTHKVQATDKPGKANLVFVIDEGSKNEIRRIRFEGNKVFTDPELRKEMKVKPKGWFSWLTKSGRFESSQLDSDLDAILDYYRSRGYLRASSPGIRRLPVADGRVDLIIPINEGEKYTVAAVNFGAMHVFQPNDLNKALTLVANSSYSSKKMRADITMIRSYYGSRGYADAAVAPDIRDAGPNRVSITYKITEGTRFHVGRVNIKGNAKSKDKVIRREGTLQPGDWFNSVELETTKARLTNLQYFSDVQVTGTPAGNGYRDVDILVEEKSTGSVGVGFGFSSIDSIVGFLTLEQSNFDLFNPWNFTGGGQRFAMNLRAGSTQTDCTMSLVEPWFLDRKLALSGDLFYRESSYFSSYYQQTNIGAAMSLRQPLGDHGSLKLEYRLEQVGVNVLSTTPALSEYVVGHEDGKFMRSSINLNYIYDTRDSNIQPRSGHKLDAVTTLAGLGGDVKSFTVSLQGQQYWNLKWDSIFSISGELASVEGLSGEPVHVFERMFLGGGRTLRGFKFRDVGPRDYAGGTDEAIGGKSLGYVSFEYTVPIIETVRAAAFYDTGFVNAASWDMNPSNIYSDAGLGIRLRLPISPMPLALDYALPLSVPIQQAKKGGQFNFYLLYQY
ncbi:MAG: outer membrane protein assembly factor BamA [Verrucomicrobia bacterium]|nr:MAG: outer membrane protein assembly factor BamA [Verrucomicrobiota bacterium]